MISQGVGSEKSIWKTQAVAAWASSNFNDRKLTTLSQVPWGSDV